LVSSRHQSRKSRHHGLRFLSWGQSGRLELLAPYAVSSQEETIWPIAQTDPAVVRFLTHGLHPGWYWQTFLLAFGDPPWPTAPIKKVPVCVAEEDSVSRILIEHGLVVPVDGTGDCWRRGWLLVDDGRIADMGQGETKADWLDTKRIDASGMAVLPGLVDAHTHLGPTGLFRGFAEDLTHEGFLALVSPILDQIVDYDDMHAAARLGCLESLKAGTTCASELGLAMDPVARAVEEVGIRCALGPDVSDIASLTDYVGGGAVFDEALGEKAIAAADDVYQRWQGAANGRLSVRFANFSALTCSPGLLRRTRELADKRGVGIDIHVLTSEDSVARGRSQFGKDTMVALAELGYLASDVSVVHLLHPSDDDIAAVAASGAHMVQCPMAYAKAGQCAPLKAIREAGIEIAIGSDWLTMDMWQQMRCAMILARLDVGDSPVIDAAQVLEMATVRAARAVGQGDEIGSLEIGKRADMILINLDQPHLAPLGPHYDPVTTLVHNATGRDVATVLVDGEVVVENGEAVTVDEAEVIATASQHAEQVMTRAGTLE